MFKTPPNLNVQYKYNIRMQPINDSIKNFIYKLGTKHFDKLYDGNILILVSPILTRNKEKYVFPMLDIDTNFNKGLSLLKTFFSKENNRKLWYAEYTGKNAFHLYFKYLVKLPQDDDIINNIAAIRSFIFKNLKTPLMQYVDLTSSIREVPIVRIGHREDTNRMAVPMLKLDREWIVKASMTKGFENTFDKSMLSDYIKKYIFPMTVIESHTYNQLIAKVV